MNFSFNPWALSWALGAVVTLLLLLYSAKIPFKRRYHELWIMTLAARIVFQSAYFVQRASTDVNPYLPLLAEIARMGTTLAPLLSIHFAFEFTSPQLGRIRKYSLFAAYGALFILWGAMLSNPNLLITRFIRTPLGYFNPVSGPLDLVFSSWTIILLILTVIVLFRFYVSQESPVMKTQARYLIAGYLLVLSAGVLINSTRVFPQILQYGGAYLDFIQNLLYAPSTIVQYVGFTKYGLGPVTPVAETVSVAPEKFRLSPGAAYLTLEQEPSRAFEAFSDLIKHGHFGLCVTRSSPDVVRERYRLEKTPVRWLASLRRDDAIEPRDLLGLSLTVGQFLQAAPGSVVLLHGLEFLASVNGFKPVLQLVQRLNEVAVDK